MSEEHILSRISALSISEITNYYRIGAITPLQVIKRQLTELDRVNIKVNAIAKRFDTNSILQKAKQSTIRYQTGKILGPFDGIPITIKDVAGNALQGVPYTKGIFNPKYHITPKQSIPAIDALVSQGAVILCQTTCPELSQKTQTSSYLHGTTNNPHNLRLCTGGSSGGAACLTALGIGCINVGSDGGGSIRIPASICGVYGLRTTVGVGRFTPFPAWTTVGPLCRRIDDIELFLKQMPDNFNYPKSEVDEIHKKIKLKGNGVKNYRIAVSKDLDGAVNFVDDLIWNALLDKVKYLNNFVNCSIEFIDPPIYNSIKRINGHYMDVWNKMKKCIMASDYPNYFKDNKLMLDKIDLNIHQMMYDGKTKISGIDIIKCIKNRERFCEIIYKFFDRYDILITPTVPILTPKQTDYRIDGFLKDKIDGKTKLWTDCYHSNAAYTTLSTVTAIPGLSMPMQYLKMKNNKKMPIGMLIMSGLHQEEKILKIAKVLQNKCKVVMAKL
eukprot:345094_1